MTDTILTNNTFASFGLAEKTLRALDEAGFTEPTPIQAQAIPVVLRGKDLLGVAQTGTGKTASFVLPILEILSTGRAKARMPRSLILAPTRELAMQVKSNIELFGKYHRMSYALLIGGTSPVEQERALMAGCDILIATPGRLMEHFEKGKILLNDIKVLVIDEADRMLDMGFIPDIEKIIGFLPVFRQTCMFSATMPKAIRELANRFLSMAEEITIEAKQMTGGNITQYCVPVGDSFKAKREVLVALLVQTGLQKAIIFCNRKTDVTLLTKALQKDGYRAAAIHGDLTQSERMRTLDEFKADSVDLLIASDVAARGLHVENLPAVINFDPPRNPDDFVHRVGRTGRAGQSGVAYTLAKSSEAELIEAIIAYTRLTFTEYTLPEGLMAITAEAERTGAPASRRMGARPRSGDRTREPGSSKSSEKTTSPEKVVAEKNTPEKSAASAKGLGDHVPAFLLRG